MMSVQASFHQGDRRFKGNGRQCGVISAVAIQHLMYISKPKSWTSETLNKLLFKGDDLYCTLSQKMNTNEFLTFEDISSNVQILTTSLHGTLNFSKTDGPIYCLYDALNDLLMSEPTCGCLITIGSSVPAYSMAILRADDIFYVFDPHSRNDTGMMSCDGYATMTLHKDIQAVTLFVRHLAASLKVKNAPFEIAKMCYKRQLVPTLTLECPENIDNDSDKDSVFSGFSSVSENIIGNCVSPEISEVSEISDVNTSDISFCDETSLSSVITESDLQNLDQSDLFLRNINLDFLDDIDDDDNGNNPNHNQAAACDDLCGNGEDCNDNYDCVVDNVGDDDDNCDENCDYSDDNVGDDGDNCGENCDYRDDNVGDDGDNYGDNCDYSDDNVGGDGDNCGDYYDCGDDDNVFCDPDYDPTIDDVDDDDDDVPLIKLKNKYKHDKNDNKVCNISRTKKTEYKLTYSGATRNENNNVIQTKHCAEADRNATHKVKVSEVNDRSEEFDGDISNRPKQGRGRKRVRNEKEWKRNVAKQKRNEGLEYVSCSTWKTVRAREIKPGCGQKCRYKCHSKFTIKDRESIFHSFWRSGGQASKWQFLSQYARSKPKMSKQCGQKIRNRKYSITWTLPCTNSEPLKVCKTFFLHTLSVSSMMVKTANFKLHLCLTSADNRGKHVNRKNKTNQEVLNSIRKHIESFQCVQSHYCRKDSKRDYLPPGLTIQKMYFMYQRKCESLGLNHPASLKVYRNIFNTEYNIGFHKPLKDQCNFCISYENFPSDIKLQRKVEYDRHIFNKEKARFEKNKDKELAHVDNQLIVACFDLEEVLLTPQGKANAMYYKRRLNTYNFTIYEFGTKNGYSYIWNECVAARGACEIASCLFHFIKLKHSEGKSKFIFYSDNCGARNKNKFHVSMLWFCLQKFNLKSITHKYLEKGHTFNEADSMHSAIERASSGILVNTTAQWAATVRLARYKQPYHVKEMCLADFYDFRKVADVLKNFQVNVSKDKVDWFGIKILSFSSSNTNVFKYFLDYEGIEYAVDLSGFTRAKDIPNPKLMTLKRLRDNFIRIKRDKYRDLLTLCMENIIEKAHHDFFLLLPHE